ncbi:MAG: transglycosylase SLT domain-containing protein [Deltaproteobacteria bacterium]|nr:transglycosylase SLT domain-containing protein [Deltaproteobacteria bacterium]
MKKERSILFFSLILFAALSTESFAKTPSLSEIIDQIPSGEGMTTAPFENFTEIAGGKQRYLYSKPKAKLSAKPKTVKPPPRADSVPRYYPLRPFNPLTEMIQKNYGHGLSVSKKMEPAVDFWRNVYARYELNQTILHDNRDMSLVYGILDFSDLDADFSLSDAQRRAIRAAVEADKKEELRAMLLRFQSGHVPETAGEEWVFGFFKNIPGPEKFAKAAGRIRAQWGQKDRFAAGLVRAGRYMPMMEEIFIRNGVPKEITNLVFVESMFNLKAFSKVGAAGPWQFMPATAKLYMTINATVDERLDPLIAAQAAARFLLKNHEIAGTWPLAINGYNTGILRMVKARDRLGTHDISVIIENFNDPGYQFASRNFFPEFMAALEVAVHHKDYFGELVFDEPLPFDEIILPYHASFQELSRATGTDVGVLRDLNPAYYEKNFEPHVFIPKGYTLRVPHRQKMVFLAALDQAHNHDSDSRWHRVGKGESLKLIAQRYQISLDLLKESNGLLSNRIEKGHLLKIPGEPPAIVLETH